MKLKEVLQAAGVNENTYHTLRRQAGSLPFMSMRLTSDVLQDRYTVAHAFALSVLRELQALSLSVEVANELVTRSFDHLRAYAHDPDTITPRHSWLSVMYFEDSVDLYAGPLDGLQSSAPEGRRLDGVTSLNLFATWLRLKERLPSQEPSELGAPASRGSTVAA